MQIPRYRTYWRASGLWAIRRIPRPWRVGTGMIVATVGVGLTQALVTPDWLGWAAGLVVCALGVGLICLED